MVLRQIEKRTGSTFSNKCQGCGLSINIEEEGDVMVFTHGILIRGYFVAIEHRKYYHRECLK